MCAVCVHMCAPMCNCIPMCAVHICSMCMCVYTCEKWGITLSPNCSGLSTTHQMASASGVNLEPTWGWGLSQNRGSMLPSGSLFLGTWLCLAQLLCPLNVFVVAITHVSLCAHLLVAACSWTPVPSWECLDPVAHCAASHLLHLMKCEC